MLLREILRPGVLWFLRNLNDHNFHPVQEVLSISWTEGGRGELAVMIALIEAIYIYVYTCLYIDNLCI